MSRIHSEDQVRRFHDLLVVNGLEEYETLFLSLSARSKYLTEEERKQYDLGRTEMFLRHLVPQKGFPWYLSTLKRMLTPGGSLTRSGLPVPSKCLVVYANINPLDGKKALYEPEDGFLAQVNKMSYALTSDRSAEYIHKFANLQTELLNCYQKARSRKNWVDIDFDLPKDDPWSWLTVKTFVSRMTSEGCEVYVIETHGGFHVLVRTKTVRFNFHEPVTTLNEMAKKRYTKAEIVINSNSMVPVPGTCQADFEVTMFTSEEFLAFTPTI